MYEKRLEQKGDSNLNTGCPIAAYKHRVKF